MGILSGKRGLICGVANNRSIAWGIAEACHREGATLGFTYVNEAIEKRVRPLADTLGSDLIVKCDVQNEAEVKSCFAEVKERWGKIDFLVHSIAFADGEDLKNPFSCTSRAGFSLAMDVSAYSLVLLAREALPLFDENGGSILTLTYLGSTQVVPNYRVMGVAKAALEGCVRELAVEFGERNVRVNAVSAGPIKTLAAAGIADFKKLLGAFEDRAPMKRMVTIEDVGDSSVFFLSPLSRAITGETIFVDNGFHITAV